MFCTICFLLLCKSIDAFAEKRDVKSAVVLDRKYMKKESIYLRATKPFREAENLIKQAENYTHYEELVERYNSIAV